MNYRGLYLRARVIECDYDYWYERGNAGYGREIDKFLIELKNA